MNYINVLNRKIQISRRLMLFQQLLRIAMTQRYCSDNLMFKLATKLMVWCHIRSSTDLVIYQTFFLMACHMFQIIIILKVAKKCLSFLYNFILLKKLSSIPSFDYSVYFDVNLIENGPIVTPQLDAPFWSFWRPFFANISRNKSPILNVMLDL